MGKRFLFYINGITKPITITDKNEKRDIKELITEISEFMSNCPVVYFSNECDGVLLRSSEISGVCITNIEDNLRKEEVKVLDLSDIESNKTNDVDLLEEIPEISETEKELSDILESTEEIEEIEDLLDEETLKELEKEEPVEDIYTEKPKVENTPKAKVVRRNNKPKRDIDKLPGVVPVKRMPMPPSVKTDPMSSTPGASVQQHNVSELKNTNMGRIR